MAEMIPEYKTELEIFNQFVFADNLENGDKLQIIQEALELGALQAEEIRKEFGLQMPKALLESLGIRVEYETGAQKLNENYVKFAEFYAKTKVIRLNGPAVKKLDHKMKKGLAEDIILCHELYHYFELARWGRASERFIRTVKLFGLIPVKRRMLPASELAANSFTKTYLGLDFNPQIIEKYYFDTDNI
ncbi:hypothetical protein GPL15_24370 [Clostridium sp. MCC353]|uniref:hypothetical protein n=1 Tax=Clostridium sp. MCC353 TaxID=2592646 RepID=UPI001C026A4A|nr:hypothetical protein [Clostridium sp. MCC353]MBT9779619.1 hypothetical protein [Clostridium sp. MCC353]